MFEKFGEFDSAEELNRAAAAQLAEGDTEAVITIALENGLEKEDAEDYINGDIKELFTPVSAALGKLETENRELKLQGIMKDWADCVTEYCMEDEKVCIGIRKKGKKLSAFLGKLLKAAFEGKGKVPDEITKAAGLTPPLYMGIPGRAEIKKLIREYYGEEGKK